MKAKVIEQEGQNLVVELENGVKRVIKMDRAADLKGKEVFLVREGGIFPAVQLIIEHTWKSGKVLTTTFESLSSFHLNVLQ